MICDEKASSNLWLKIHETAHRLGIPSNATMLYGHIEIIYSSYRPYGKASQLQDKTGGFNAFIPFKYKKSNNSMSYLGEVNTHRRSPKLCSIEDLPRQFSSYKSILANDRKT